MTHRLLFIISGLLLMFVVMTAVMMVGKTYDPNQGSMLGFVIMLSVLVTAMAVFFQLGLRTRKRQHALFLRAIDILLRYDGRVLASQFARLANISLDSAREVLDAMSKDRSWTCVERDGYDAEYRS